MAISVVSEESLYINIHYINYHSDELFVIVEKLDLD